MAKIHLGYLNIWKQRGIVIFVDWFTTFLAFLCFNVFRCFYFGMGHSFREVLTYITFPKLIFEEITVPVCLLGVYWLSGYYNRPFDRSRLQEFLLTLYSQLFNAVVIYLAALTNDQLYLRRENWLLLLILFLLLFTFTYIGRLAVTDNMLKKLKRRNIKPRTVIIGLSDEALKLSEKTTDRNYKVHAHIVGFMPFGNERISDEVRNRYPEAFFFEDIEALKALCRNNAVDQVIIVPSPGKSQSKKILFLLYNLYPLDISIKISPDIISIITPTIRLQDILGEPFVDLATPQISEFSKNVKRTFDVIVSAVGLAVLSPLFLALGIAIKRSSPGSVLYRQERIGLHRKPFMILKFRSMVENAEKNGLPQLSSDNDSRITGIGKWMRKYRLDELPQLWNVLKGDMAFVGPRPERAYFIEQIIKKAPWYTLVLQVRPGITSWGMVKYGYATDIDQMIERNRYDLIYLANMSVAVDFKILIYTVKTVGMGEGK